MSHSFRLITLGCKVNQYESAYIRDGLTQAGWYEVRARESARVTIVNTCIVTQRAAHQSRQAIRRAIRENPDGWVAAVGCYPQVYSEAISSIPGVSIIAGNVGKASLPGLIVRAVNSGTRHMIAGPFPTNMSFESMPIRSYKGRTRAFLKIQDGCQSFCTYCIVPYARGPSRSLPVAEVLHGLRSLCERGYREVVLTGVHLGNYGLDLPGEINLVRLLRDIGREGLDVRIRLSSLEPNEIGQELVEMVGEEPWLCPHFHIPLQSGDDTVLNRMNRVYTKDEFVSAVRNIYEIMPCAAIGADILAGFPGEREEAHKNTCSLIHELPVSYLHVFPYSPRPGTAAAVFPEPLDTNTIKKRAAELRFLGQEKRDQFYQSCVNGRFEVLVEDRNAEDDAWFQGTSENYLSVLFSSPQDKQGQIVTVLATGVDRNKILGSAVGESV